MIGPDARPAPRFWDSWRRKICYGAGFSFAAVFVVAAVVAYGTDPSGWWWNLAYAGVVLFIAMMVAEDWDVEPTALIPP